MESYTRQNPPPRAVEDGADGPDFLPDLPEPVAPVQPAAGVVVDAEDAEDDTAPAPEGKLPGPDGKVIHLDDDSSDVDSSASSVAPIKRRRASGSSSRPGDEGEPAAKRVRGGRLRRGPPPTVAGEVVPSSPMRTPAGTVSAPGVDSAFGGGPSGEPRNRADAAKKETRRQAMVKTDADKMLKEITDLKAAAKNMLHASLLAHKLDERDRLHEEATLDLGRRAEQSDTHQAEAKRLTAEVKTMADSHATAIRNHQEALRLLEAELEMTRKAKEEEVSWLKERLDLVSAAAIGYYPEADDILRHGRARELGVAPDSEEMIGWEASAEDRVALLGVEAKALRDAGEAVFAATWDSEAPPEAMAE